MRGTKISDWIIIVIIAIVLIQWLVDEVLPALGELIIQIIGGIGSVIGILILLALVIALMGRVGMWYQKYDWSRRGKKKRLLALHKEIETAQAHYDETQQHLLGHLAALDIDSFDLRAIPELEDDVKFRLEHLKDLMKLGEDTGFNTPEDMDLYYQKMRGDVLLLEDQKRRLISLKFESERIKNSKEPIKNSLV